MARHDFRFAVDGFELTDDESSKVAGAIQAAGLEALASMGRGPALGFSIGGGLGDSRGLLEEYKIWRGYWLLEGGALGKVLPGLQHGGVLDQMQNGIAT